MSSAAIHTTFPALFLLLVVLVHTDTVYGAHQGKCEKIKIPFCQQLGYNLTIFPNNLEHETQDEARTDASEFTSLVESQCSKDIVYFLCSLYAPVCTMMAIAIPPCRSLCNSARNGCEDLMNNYGFRWPERFSCDNFPKFGEDLCVGRNASSSTAGKSGSIRKNLKRPGKKIAAAKKLRQKHCASTTRGQGKLCCKLGRRASKKGFYCNLKKKEEPQTRKSIKFRKIVVRKCSKFSSCFRSCCEIREKRKRIAASRKN